MESARAPSSFLIFFFVVPELEPRVLQMNASTCVPLGYTLGHVREPGGVGAGGPGMTALVVPSKISSD
jgi:hypothetical protein